MTAKPAVARLWSAATGSLLLFFITAPAVADTLYLNDGSRLQGRIGTSDAEAVTITTGFAGELRIPLTALAGITSDSPLQVSLTSDDRIRGRLAFDPASGTQRLLETAFGDVTLAAGRLAAVWRDGTEAPDLRRARQAHRAELARVNQDHEAVITEVRTRLEKLSDPWSGRITLGFDSAAGNSQRLQISGRAEARRETERDRLLLYAEGQMQEQQKVLTDKEVRLGANVEHDLNSRWFTFLRQELEKDKFERLELRSKTIGGIGWFALRRPGHEWKLRGGVGYQFESFENGTDNMQGIIPLGYDYLIDMNDWLRFTHELTVFPAIDDPFSDFRVDSNIGFEVPLGVGGDWKLRLGLRHEYDRLPAAGVRSLDTTYGADIVLDIK